ncbi:MAG: hypothetical protein H0V26_11195 [Solirubrobacterales bacterium]|nr:hypothetical protein [Solirubrobacterales bacterium]
MDEIQSRSSIRYSSYPGAAAGLHIGSAGKVLIAFLDDDDCLRALRLVESLPPDQKPDMAALSAELERVRKQGYALSMGEPVPGAAAISVPVRGHRFLVSLSVLGPESRLNRKRRLELLPRSARRPPRWRRRSSATLSNPRRRPDEGRPTPRRTLGCRAARRRHPSCYRR